MKRDEFFRKVKELKGVEKSQRYEISLRFTGNDVEKSL